MASSISLSARLPLALLVRPAEMSRGGDAWRSLVGRMGSGLWSGTCHGKPAIVYIDSPAIVSSAIISIAIASMVGYGRAPLVRPR